MATNKLMALQELQAEKVNEARSLIDAVEAEDRDFSKDEQAKYDAISADITSLKSRIDRENKMIESERAMVKPAIDQNQKAAEKAAIVVGNDLSLDDPKGGFKNYGEFCAAVHQAASGGDRDPRLKIGAAATTYGNEGTGADGGYLVPPEFAREIKSHALEEDSLVPMTDNNPVTGNSMTFPADETTPFGSDGVRAYWEGEAATGTQTKPVLKERTLRLRKLFALVPVTEELLSDANALPAYLTKKTGESIRFKTNDSLINGTGAGQPLGILNAGALVSVAKEGSQVADTVVAENIAKMYARAPGASKSRGVWMINDDVLPQLLTMTLGDHPIYMPPSSGFTNAPGGILLGRPVIPTQSCKTVGDKGDIYFADWSQYLTITKAGGVEFATSMHLWFDQDISAFRAIFRIDGQPWLNSSITPANGSNNLSPFVTLDARA